VSRGEPMWQPISARPTIAMLRDAREHCASLLEAQPKPYVLDDATIARVKRVNGEGLEYCDVYEEQLRRWRSARLTDVQRREVAHLESATRKLRLVLGQILALAAELAGGTIERQLSRSDAEIGVEYGLRVHPRG
jgi:hypothetical protein